MRSNYVFSFTTADAAPSVTTTSPADGATHVAVNTNIVVNFSEPVTARMLVATAVLIVGVFLIVSAEKPEPARHAHHPLTSGHGIGRGVYLVRQPGSALVHE